MKIGYLKGKEMKKEEKKIVNFLNIYSNYPIKECEDEYNRFDAYNSISIIELKYRKKHYDQTMIEFDKFSYNHMYSKLINKSFIYIVRMMDFVYIFDINKLVEEGYNFNFNWRDLPKTTEFFSDKNTKKFVGYIDIEKAIKKFVM